jgi:uncharacterized membrane protein
MRVHTPKKTLSLSKRAFLLGMTLIVCQILDGILTYFGLRLLGFQAEGNGLLRNLIQMYGAVPALFVTKMVTLISVATLTIAAHRRKWIRPIIFSLCAVYITLAIVPWVLVLVREM